MKKESLLNIFIGAWIATGFLYGATDNSIFLGMCAMCFVGGFLVMGLKDQN